MNIKTFFKVAMFNLSLFPLYIILFIQHFDVSHIHFLDSFLELKLFIKTVVYPNGLILFIVVVLVLLGLLGLYLFKNNLQYGREDAQIFNNIKSKEFEHLTFIATYVLPLLAYQIKDVKSFIVFLLLLILIGFLYVKLNWYYLNPVLLLFGYSIYSAEANSANVILIAKFSITKNKAKSRYIDLGKNIWYLVDKCE